MKKLLQITAIIIIFIIAALYFLDGLEYTEAEREWCKEHRPLLPIEILCKRIWVLRKNISLLIHDITIISSDGLSAQQSSVGLV